MYEDIKVMVVIRERNSQNQCWNVDLATLVTEIANSSWVTDKAML